MSPAMQVNKIRQSLRLVARNSTAFGLHQPHMERTKLCELGDDQLDPKYIQQRAGLRELVQQLAKPKRVNGKVMMGPALAELVSQMVTALNARDIPTAGSILEHFNKELVYRYSHSDCIHKHIGAVQQGVCVQTIALTDCMPRNA